MVWNMSGIEEAVSKMYGHWVDRGRSMKSAGLLSSLVRGTENEIDEAARYQNNLSSILFHFKHWFLLSVAANDTCTGLSFGMTFSVVWIYFNAIEKS